MALLEREILRTSQEAPPQGVEETFRAYLIRIIDEANTVDNPYDYISQIASTDPENLITKDKTETSFIVKCKHCKDGASTIITIRKTPEGIITFADFDAITSECNLDNHAISEIEDILPEPELPHGIKRFSLLAWQIITLQYDNPGSPSSRVSS